MRAERRLIERPVTDDFAGGTLTGNLLPWERVHNFRVLRGWTQAHAAEWWGVSERTWRRYEAPGWRGDARLLKRIRAWTTRACPEYAHYVT